MSRKHLCLVLAAIILLFALTAVIDFKNNHKNTNNTTVTVYGESGYYSIDEIAKDIETHPYYKRYNKTTLDWFKTLDGVVVPSSDGFVVMSESDCTKLNIEFATDVIIEDTVSCKVVEKRSIGDNLKNITVISNVELVSQNTTESWA